MEKWRVKNPAEGYLYINSKLEIQYGCDFFVSIDTARWEIGNYFKTKEKAEEKLKKIKKILRED